MDPVAVQFQRKCAKFLAIAWWCHATALLRISYLMIFSYSLSLPLESRQRLYITDASTLAGLYVLGSFNNEITDSKIVLRWETQSINKSNSEISSLDPFFFSNFAALCTHLTFWVGFHLSQGNSPLCGSSTGGCRIDMHRSPFYTKKEVAFYTNSPNI